MTASDPAGGAFDTPDDRAEVLQRFRTSDPGFASSEKDGSFTNTQRMVLWHHAAMAHS